MNKRKNNVCKAAIAIIVAFVFLAPGATVTANNDKNTTEMGWIPQNSGTTENLNGLSFTTDDTGTTVGDTATILRTTDEGTTWIPQSCGVTVGLNDVSFYNDNTGMAVGHEGTIIQTTNGGTSWNTVQTGWMTSYYGAHMITSTHGFAVGVNTIFQPLVTWTTDGWNSYDSVAFYLQHNNIGYEGDLLDVHFVNASTGFTAAAVWNGEGAIAQTTDGGWTWDTIYWAPYVLHTVHFPTETTGYSAGASGTIYKTTNGGTTWTSLSSGVNQRINDIWFTSEKIGTAVGENGLILRTEDGGTTWTIQDSGTYVDINGVTFLDDDNGFAVGKIGTILHTTNGGWSNQPPETPEAPTGPDTGFSEKEYSFSAVTTDPDGDDIYYLFDWDDGTNSGWLGPYDSGATVTAHHIWTDIGEYDITVKAKDELGHESGVSPPHTIVIMETPSLEIEGIKGGLFRISATIKNNGSQSVDNIQWNISLDGGFILFGSQTTGQISVLEPGAEQIINSDPIIGFGKTMVTITAYVPESIAVEEQEATIFLFFIIM
ncbi:MAG: YCF48-related protein [Thermoplasmatota archaeon]